jgi:uncharacterized flavoprotein (TIGR03862 family)
MTSSSRTIAIIGGGPAGLMAAEAAAKAGARVVIFERMPSLGRKFLLAGRGGLNLTHSEPLDAFLGRYGSARAHLAALIETFPPQALRDWALELGEETFVGTSGRVFPKRFKTSPLLRAWLRRLASTGVEVRLRHAFEGWEADGSLRFSTPEGQVIVQADATVLAMGGASWPRLGSDGGWTKALAAAGVDIAPLRPSNCGFETPWTAHLREKFAGAPLKPVAIGFADIVTRGECIITEHGLEGGAIYALSARLRDEIERAGEALITIDLRPDVTLDALATRLAAPRAKQSASTFLRKAGGLSPQAIALLREPGPLPDAPETLAARIKGLPIRLVAARPIDRAISTAGGVRFDELDDRLMIKNRPGIFVAGEMIDWEAPTGGYLLQACFATGKIAGEAAAGFTNRD